jgi:glycosyltransferase involved in cell wall biosynthesis
MNDNIPKVTVCVVTYNHEKYIEECLESLVTQECNFDFEIIVSDDCSTDNTRNIINDFAQKYSFVKPILREKNIGAFENFVLTHQLATGEYICHMDGDDYALPGKLQTQADFMDKTPDCNICFHRIKALFPDGTIKDDLIDYEKIKNGFERKDLLTYMAVATHSSKMYRKEVREFDIPPFPVLDFYVNVEQIGNKKAYFVNDKIYGVYRQGVGIGQNISTRYYIIKTLDFFSKKYPQYKLEINTLVLLHFLLDVKNKRKTWLKNFILFIKTFHIKSFFILQKAWEIIKIFRLPRKENQKKDMNDKINK